MGNSTNVSQKLILDAMKTLYNKSGLPASDRWFSRGDIARQIGAIKGLSTNHVKALKALSQGNGLEERQRPEETRQFPEYSLSAK